MSRLASMFTGLLVGRAVALGLQVLSYGLTARAIGPQEFGPLAAAVAIVSVLVVVSDAGLNSATIRALAADTQSDTWRSMVRSKVRYAAGLAAIWTVTAVVLLTTGRTAPFVLPLALYLFCDVLCDSLMARDIALAMPRRPAQVLIVRRFISAVITLCLLASFGPLALTCGLAMGSLTGALAALRYQRRHLGKGPVRRDVRAELRHARPFWITSLAAQVQNLDNVLVAVIAGSYQAGLYGAPARIIGPMGLLGNTFAAAVLPISARPHHAAEIWKPAIYVAVLSGAVFGLAALLTPSIVDVILGQEFEASTDVLRFLLIGMWLSTLNQPLVGYLQGVGHADKVSQVLLTVMPVGLFLAGVGSVIDGADGAAIGVVVTQLAILLGLANVARSNIESFRNDHTALRA